MPSRMVKTDPPAVTPIWWLLANQYQDRALNSKKETMRIKKTTTATALAHALQLARAEGHQGGHLGLARVS